MHAKDIDFAFEGKVPIGIVDAVRHGACALVRKIPVLFDIVGLVFTIVILDADPQGDQVAVSGMLADDIDRCFTFFHVDHLWYFKKMRDPWQDRQPETGAASSYSLSICIP